MDKVIPDDTSMAAKRAFVRTTAQSYSATLATGISASAIIANVEGGINWAAVGIMTAVAVVSPLLGGLSAYLSVIHKGIPGEYQDSDYTQSHEDEEA